MNKALNFKNWREGGKYYIRQNRIDRKWVSFYESVIERLKRKFGDDFFLTICTDRNKENDFWNIPFKKLKHLFTEDHKTTGKHGNLNRWTAHIRNNNFMMKGNGRLAVDIKEDYGNLHASDENDPSWRVEKGVEYQKRKIIALKRKYGPHGQGKKHEKLQNWIAEHPDRNELEHVFLSGDAVDILFELTDNTDVVVEIETDDPLPGCHQVIKYRALRCAERGFANLTSNKVRAVVVAWEIPNQVGEFCSKYKIESFEKRLPPVFMRRR